MNGPNHREDIVREREDLVARLQAWLEIPMLLLSVAWLVLLVIEMVWGLSNQLQVAVYAIWAVFILDFVVKLTLAPLKLRFLRSNWLSVISLALPALRMLRVISLLRVARIAKMAGMVRGLRVLRVLTSINRGMSALGSSMHRRGFGYIVLLTVMVTFAGAAGMYSFEKEFGAMAGLDSYGTALWWTAMIMTTMGSQYWPQSPEGRALCLILAVYSLTVFGYITATLATYFIGRDAESDDTEIAGAKAIAALRQEILALRSELRSQRLINNETESTGEE